MSNRLFNLLLLFCLILGASFFVPGGLLAIHYHNHGTGEAADWYPVTDLRGDIVALIDAATGDQVATYAYTPFGQTLQATGPAADKNPIRFQSKYHDADTGLVYFGLRHYSPEMSQWLSRDPMGEAGGLNLYAYTGNDPVNFADALGLKAERYGTRLDYDRHLLPVTRLENGLMETRVLHYREYASNALRRALRMYNRRETTGRSYRPATHREVYYNWTFNEQGELVPLTTEQRLARNRADFYGAMASNLAGMDTFLDGYADALTMVISTPMGGAAITGTIRGVSAGGRLLGLGRRGVTAPQANHRQEACPFLFFEKPHTASWLSTLI
ncbi:MAG: RHS repeat-associated core domain-containing protein [Opitutales bacterium]|nr:RHS repeat-associated core domain-containing protein [Opitutales bacterium]